MSDSSRPVDDVIRGRRTVNLFRAEPVPSEVVWEAIELARWAPNHKHTEPWRFHRLGPRTVAAVVELNARLVAEAKGAAAGEAKRLRWGAVPGWLAVTCARSPDDPLREEEDYAACCCAIQNLALALWARGVGVKWSTGDVTRHAEFHALLEIDPAERRVVGLLWYGYPEVVPEQRRKPVEEITVDLP